MPLCKSRSAHSTRSGCRCPRAPRWTRRTSSSSRRSCATASNRYPAKAGPASTPCRCRERHRPATRGDQPRPAWAMTRRRTQRPTTSAGGRSYGQAGLPRELLNGRAAGGFAVCIGLDSSLDRLPECPRAGDPQLASTARSSTRPPTCRGLQAGHGFLRGPGAAGIEVGRAPTVAHIRVAAPHVQRHRGREARGHRQYPTTDTPVACSDVVGAGRDRRHPYLGSKAATAFLARPDKGVFVLPDLQRRRARTADLPCT